jgi:hypothetical protein
MALRLKIVGGRIAEIETVLNRGSPMASSMPPVRRSGRKANPLDLSLSR